MEDQNKLPPEYSEKMILTLINNTTSIEDLMSLAQLIKDLEEQKDLIITEKIRREIFQRTGNHYLWGSPK